MCGDAVDFAIIVAVNDDDALFVLLGKPDCRILLLDRQRLVVGIQLVGLIIAKYFPGTLSGKDDQMVILLSIYRIGGNKNYGEKTLRS